MPVPLIPIVVAGAGGLGLGLFAGSEISRAIKLALAAGAVYYVYTKTK